jgi:DNA-binding MarR family transcriptional regulator
MLTNQTSIPLRLRRGKTIYVLEPFKPIMVSIGKDKADVSRMTAIMERNGLLTKEGSSYRALLKLTDMGCAAAQKVRERASVAVENASRGLSDEHREIFYGALELIVTNLQNISEKGLPE